MSRVVNRVGHLARKGFHYIGAWRRCAGLRRDLRRAQEQGTRIIVLEAPAYGLREHWDPLICTLCARPKMRVVLAVYSHELEKFRSSYGAQGNDLAVDIIPFDNFPALRVVPDAIVSFYPASGLALSRYIDPQKTIRVVLTHTLSDKEALFSDRYREDALADFDVLFLSGPIMHERFHQQYVPRCPDTAERLLLVPAGYPKVDTLFDGRYDRTATLQRLGFGPQRSTVLYAPTWEREASLEVCGVEAIESLASLDVNLLVKPHYMSLVPGDAHGTGVLATQYGHGGKDWRKTLLDFENRFSNMRFIQDNDVNPYLVAADLMVTDVSGVGYEFVLLNKPIVFIDVPQLFEKLGTTGIHYWGRSCGDIVFDIADLASTVQRNLDHPRAKGKERVELGEKLVYNKGSAATKTVEALEGLLDGRSLSPSSVE